MIAQTMRDLGYHSSSADPDVWIRQAVRTDGTEYYEYCLIYVDDILCISEKPMVTLNKLKGLYTLKDEKFGPPDCYLGANLELFQTKSSNIAWSMPGREYVKIAVSNLEDTLLKEGSDTNPNGY